MARGYEYIEKIEKHAGVLGLCIAFMVSLGGLAEITPLFVRAQALAPDAAVKPYDPLRLAGRDIYVREGCYLCHSQMIRALRAETQRYGPHSTAAESVYDRPFQWGSKRTGPDLAREGGKYPNLWHYTHLIDPRATSPGSNMPSYNWLARGHVDTALGARKLELMRKLGVPYTDADVAAAEAAQRAQGDAIVADLATNGVTADWNSEIVALISYLQRLGRDQGVAPAVPAEVATEPSATAPEAR